MTDWRPIPGASGYEASSDGRISKDGAVLRQSAHKKFGYPRVYIRMEGVGSRLREVHSLVCAAFHGPRPSPKHMVRHLNGEPSDNRPENLAWGTSSENCFDRVRHGRDRGANQTHCKHGHEFTPENTYQPPGLRVSQRHCRKCSAENARIYRASRRSA